MKKIMILGIIVFLLMAIVGCQNDGPQVDTKPQPDPDEEKYLNDQISPLLSFSDASKQSVSIKQNSEYDIYQGLKALDNLEGDITSKIEADLGDFDLSVPGTYELVFYVLDRAGNVSNQLIKYITVLETYDVLASYPIYQNTISNEAQLPTAPNCFQGAYYHKVFSSKDYWLGLEAEVTLPMPDINRYEMTYNDSLNIDPNARNLDNPSLYMGGNAYAESDVGLSLKNALVKNSAGSTGISVGSYAFRPFWRYITSYDYDAGSYDRANGRYYAVSCNGSGTSKNCSGNWDFNDTQYYYLPGDQLRMIVYSPKPGYLQLQIEVISVSTLPYSVGVRTFNDWKAPEDFISPVFPSSGHGSMKAEFKRVNAIDQVANEGKPVKETTTTVGEAIWHNSYLHRNIDGILYRVAFNDTRTAVMSCPVASYFTTTGIDDVTGGETVAIHPFKTSLAMTIDQLSTMNSRALNTHKKEE